MTAQPEATHDKTVPLEAPAVEITVSEDRARIVRRGSFFAAAGVNRLRVSGCSPLVADKTVSASVASGPAGAVVADVRVRRFLTETAESRPEELAGAQARLVEASSLCAQAREKRDSLEAMTADLAAAFSLAAEEVAEDASHGSSDPAAWEGILNGIAKRWSEACRGIADAEAETAKMENAHADLEAAMRLLSDPGSVMRADFDVEVVSPEPGDLAIEISYMAPCACWRPAHTVEMLEGGARCRVSTEAFLWQRTGEDWNGVAVSFSTLRPSLGSKPPLLAEDVVVAQDRRDRVEVEARDQKVQTAGLGAAPSRKAYEMPGIDDGGSAFTVRAQGKVSAKSDAAPHRVPIGSFESPASTALVCMPEACAAAVVKLESSNSSNRPMLAGPVHLVGESGYVGRTSTLFVAPGERFELGLGPDPDIRVLRKAERVDREKSMLSKWIRTIFTVTINLSNIGPKTRRLKMTERIPVSEIEQVRVEMDEKACSPAPFRDENGFLMWEIELPAFGQSSVKYSYALDRTSDVTGL